MNYIPQHLRPAFDLSYCAAVDIGKRSDPSAFAAIERRQLMVPVTGHYRDREMRPEGDPIYVVVHATRFPLREPYPLQGQRLARMLGSRAELAECDLLVDRTGVGDGVIDQWVRDLPQIRPVVLTGGREVGLVDGEHHISKSILIAELQGALHYQTLKIPSDMPEGEAIAREAADFEVHYTATGALQWNAKSGSHDDLIIAIALALYGAAHLRRSAEVVPVLGF